MSKENDFVGRFKKAASTGHTVAKLAQPDGFRGERKGKRTAGLRGGRQSHDWGTADDSLTIRIPSPVAKRIKELAIEHDLYAWQIIVEGIACFEAKHGALSPAKKAVNE